MLRVVSSLVFLLLFAVSQFVMAQAPDYGMLDGNPYNPEKDPNPDLFISNWKESLPRHSHGSLVERDIFTTCKGDPLHPVRKGAVLTAIKRFSHASLEAHASTAPTTLHGEQEIFYIDSGKGTIKAGRKTAELHEGVGILMPPDIEFTMTNTGDEPLTIAQQIPGSDPL